MPDSQQSSQQDSAQPTTTMGLVLLAINKFGKDVALVLLFSGIIALAGRQIYRDLIASNVVVIAIAKERAEQDKVLTVALHELAKQVEATNRVITERERHELDRQRAELERERNTPRNGDK
jgi:hypothetical protein